MGGIDDVEKGTMGDRMDDRWEMGGAMQEGLGYADEPLRLLTTHPRIHNLTLPHPIYTTKTIGTNWFGFETMQRSPFGLDEHDMDFYFQFLADQKFNALRVPISVDFALDPDGAPDKEAEAKASTTTSSSSSSSNRDCVWFGVVLRGFSNSTHLTN